MARTKWRAEFTGQRFTAKSRGIEFLLTFDEWLQVWKDSGHLNERGKRKGQYQMARFGDVGPYSIWNVKIVKVEVNRAEQRTCGCVLLPSQGSSNGNSKLSEADVLQIRLRHKQGASQMRLAREYGVTNTQIWSIVRYKSWLHV